MKKNIWLYISSFGIMFAVLSWVQETFNINLTEYGWLKGCLAATTGFILYHLFRNDL
tara:strand:- start:2459 stop:2629 length:171 start_codon:yes stop_codon:yes gene_type:complete